MIVDSKLLNKAVEKIGIRFPNAELARNLDYSKGVVSEYLKGKKMPSQNFIDSFEKFYHFSFEDFEQNEYGPDYNVKYGISDIEIVEHIYRNKKRFLGMKTFRLLLEHFFLLGKLDKELGNNGNQEKHED